MCNILFLRLTAFRKMYGLVKTLVIKLGFESFVNSEESKTSVIIRERSILFESFVNSEESKTIFTTSPKEIRFESFVNSEESKTFLFPDAFLYRLRALLIQKRVKLKIPFTLSLYV